MKTDRTTFLQKTPSRAFFRTPFVCLNMPFVGWGHRVILPLICLNIPSVPFRRNSGFSMIELMITLVLIGVVAALVVPSFRGVLQNSRLTTQANTLLVDLTFARSEAIKRSAGIGFCSSSAGADCSGVVNWENGWLTFVDIDNNRAWTDGIDEPLRFQEPLAGANTLRPNATGITDPALKPIFFSGRGVSNVLAGAGFQLCDERGVSHGKSILISRVGQIRVDSNPPATCP